MGIPVLLKSPEARKALFEQLEMEEDDDGVSEISSESSQEAMPPPKNVAPKVQKGKKC